MVSSSCFANNMVIEKVHGLQATSITLNERFTLLAKATPDRVAMRPRRRSVGNILNFNNRNLIEQIARRLEQQAKRQALRHRLGFANQAPLRRFGSESSLPGLRRSNSFGNLSQQSIKNRVSWRQSNGNLSRSGSFSAVGAGVWRGRLMRGFRRRGGGQRALRGRFRGGGRQVVGRLTRVQHKRRGAARPQLARRGNARPQVARRGSARGRGRGGILRNQNNNKLLTKEELDAQLDQYMAGTKAALDRELDDYMKNAMDLE